jgi:hypothetical protein
MVSLVLVAVLRAEQVTARYQVDTGIWAHRTKWFAFLATYVMNTWQSWTGLHVAGVVLHSVPPVLVFLAAETAPVLRDRLTEAVLRAAGQAFTGGVDRASGRGAGDADAAGPVETPTAAEATAVQHGPADPVREQSGPPRRPARRKPVKKPAPRKLLADYLAEARAAHAPGVEITPAWVRSVTDCARGTSKNVADALKHELATTGQVPTPLPVSTVLDTERQAA